MSGVAVVLPVREAVQTLGSTLRNLWPQCQQHGASLIVAIGSADPTLPLAEQHTAYYTRLIIEPGIRSVPQLRAAAARDIGDAEFVFITEDHCLFPPGWIGALVHAAREHNAPVTGGGVANGRLTFAGWAQYFTRYASFAPPASSGWTHSLPGNNACYRRDVLDRYSHLLDEGFWEAEFNADLAAHEGRFWREGGFDVTQRQVRGALSYLGLRFQHGRCYGARRWSGSPEAERRRLLLRAPLIPAVLFARSARAMLPRTGLRWRFLASAPLVCLYQLSWSAGEWTGYLFGAGGSCSRTD